MQVNTIGNCLVAACILASCSTPRQVSDCNINPLDAIKAVENADVILVGYPTAAQKAERVTVASQGYAARELIAADVSLRVVLAIKGAAHLDRIVFRYYDENPKMVIGPERGLAIGTSGIGIYFLVRGERDKFRSFVDVFRPYIPTPWLSTSSQLPGCSDVRKCIADLLLVRSEGDAPERRFSSLPDMIAISRQVDGYVSTGRRLLRLSREESNLGFHAEICTAVADWYRSLVPRECIDILQERPMWREFQEDLRQDKVRARKNGPKELLPSMYVLKDKEMLEFLELLEESHDAELRRLAHDWIAKLRK